MYIISFNDSTCFYRLSRRSVCFAYFLNNSSSYIPSPTVVTYATLYKRVDKFEEITLSIRLHFR